MPRRPERSSRRRQLDTNNELAEVLIGRPDRVAAMPPASDRLLAARSRKDFHFVICRRQRLAVTGTVGNGTSGRSLPAPISLRI